MQGVTNRPMVSIGRFTVPAPRAHPKPQLITSIPIVRFRLWWSVVALVNVEATTVDI